LLSHGPDRLTTTRVAERAGVSVGTLYQLLPNKRSLLSAVLENHLDRVSPRGEAACAQASGRPLAEMVRAVVEAFVDVKRRAPTSRWRSIARAGRRRALPWSSGPTRVRARRSRPCCGRHPTPVRQPAIRHPDVVSAMAGANALGARSRRVTPDGAPGADHLRAAVPIVRRRAHALTETLPQPASASAARARARSTASAAHDRKSRDAPRDHGRRRCRFL